MAYTGRLRPKGHLFLGPQVCERVGISVVELHEMVRKSVISGFRKAKGAFHGREKVEKTLFFDKVLIGKKSVLINESECQYLIAG